MSTRKKNRRRKNRRRKRRTKKGGHATECETKKTIEMMRKIREAMEENRLKPCLKSSFKSDANKLFYDGTCSDKSDCQKHEPFCHEGKCLNQADFSAAKKKEGMEVATKRSKEKAMRELEGGPSLVGAFDDKQRANKNWRNAASKVKMANLIKNQFKEHPEHELSKGADNWHGWVARFEEREKSPNKGNIYYYKDGHATTWDAPKKGWVKVHEPQGGFYFWCPLKDIKTSERPQENSCLVKKGNNQSRGAKARRKRNRRHKTHKKKFPVEQKLVGGSFKDDVAQRNRHRQVGLASPDKCNKYTSIVSSKNLNERKKKVLAKALEKDGCFSQLKSLGQVIQTDEEGQYVELGGRRKRRRRRKTKKRKSKKRRRTKRKRN